MKKLLLIVAIMSLGAMEIKNHAIQPENVKSPDTKQKKLNQDLFDAVNEGNVEKVSKALSDGANPNTTNHRLKSTPLAWASNSLDPNKKVIALLLDKGADPNAAGFQGMTPLLWAAAQSGHGKNKEVITLLLDRGADINAVNKRGKTARDNIEVLPESPQKRAAINLLQAYQIKPVLQLFRHEPQSLFSTIPNDVLFLILEQVIGRKITQEDRTLYDQITKLPQQPVALTKEQQEIADKVKAAASAFIAEQAQQGKSAADTPKPRQ